MRRAARYGGWLPNMVSYRGRPAPELTPDVLAAAVAWLRTERAAAGLDPAGYDVVVDGAVTGDGASDAVRVREWAEAGATWWLETDWSVGRDDVRRFGLARLGEGPPR